MIKRFALILIAAFFTSLVAMPAPAFAQDTEDRAWNAGACVIEVRTADGVSYGQCYVAVDSTATHGVSVYTIAHVLEGMQLTWVTIPGFAENSEVTPERWQCDTRRGDSDTACRVFMGETAADAAVTGDYNIIPYTRSYEPTQLEVGAYIGSPRPDTGLWTIYQVTEIENNEIHIEAVFARVNGQSVPLGNFCHGRSGGPAVLISFNTRTGTVTPILRNGKPISVGELERGEGDDVRDYVDSSNSCYYSVVVNRVDTNH